MQDHLYRLEIKVGLNEIKAFAWGLRVEGRHSLQLGQKRQALEVFI